MNNNDNKSAQLTQCNVMLVTKHENIFFIVLVGGVN